MGRLSRAWTPSRRLSPSAPRAARPPRRSLSLTAASVRAAAAESVQGGEKENKKKMSKQKGGNMNFKKYERNKHCINGFSSPMAKRTPLCYRFCYPPLSQVLLCPLLTQN